MFSRPSGCSGALEAVPSPDLARNHGQPRRPTWDGPQTSRRRSLITPLAALLRTVHRRFSFWPGAALDPSKSTEDTLSLRVPKDLCSHMSFSMVRSTVWSGRPISSRENDLQPLPGNATEKCEDCAQLGLVPCPVFPSRRGSKRHGDGQLWGGEQ